MSYEMSWLVDKRVVRMRTFDVLTTDEYRSSAAEIIKMMDEGIGLGPVHVIVDHIDVVDVQYSPSIIKELIFPKQHPNAGWTVMVAASKLAKFSVGLIVQLNKAKMKTCDTMEEAWDILQRVDQSLLESPLPTN